MLSAKDIHDQEFRLVRHATGYDIEEVDAFLELVEVEIARLNAEVASLQAQLDDARGEHTGLPALPDLATVQDELERRVAALRASEEKIRGRLTSLLEAQLQELRNLGRP